MTFQYELTYEEYVEASRAKSRLAGSGSHLLYLVGLSGFAIGFFLLISRPDAGGPIAPLLLMALSLFSVLYPLHHASRNLKAHWAHNPSVRQSFTFSLGPDAITWTTPLSRNESNYTSFQRIIETRQFFLLQRGKHDLIPIPKRAVTSPESLTLLKKILFEKIPGPVVHHPRPKGFEALEPRNPT
jgi:hypothetical protein